MNSSTLRGRKNIPRPRPLESFSPRLKQLLLSGAERKLEMFAHEDKSPPELFPKNFDLPEDISTSRVVNTRWHQCVFADAQSARRFKAFMNLAQRLHQFRLAMKEASDPDTKRVYNVLISVEDRTGRFSVSPTDAPLDELLDEIISNIDVEAPDASEFYTEEQDLSDHAHPLFAGDDDPLNAL